MNLILQILAFRGQLPGNMGKVVRNAVVNLRKFFIPELLLLPVVDRLLLLPCKNCSSPFHIVPVVVPDDHVSAPGFSLDLFQVDDHIGGIFNQCFIMGDKKKNVLPLKKKSLQKFQSADIQIIGRFIQKKHSRLVDQNSHELRLDLFSSGQTPQFLILVKEIRGDMEFHCHLR